MLNSWQHLVNGIKYGYPLCCVINFVVSDILFKSTCKDRYCWKNRLLDRNGREVCFIACHFHVIISKFGWKIKGWETHMVCEICGHHTINGTVDHAQTHKNIKNIKTVCFHNEWIRVRK